MDVLINWFWDCVTIDVILTRISDGFIFTFWYFFIKYTYSIISWVITVTIDAIWGEGFLWFFDNEYSDGRSRILHTLAVRGRIFLCVKILSNLCTEGILLKVFMVQLILCSIIIYLMSKYLMMIFSVRRRQLIL